MKNDLIKKINKFAGKLYGFEVIISKDKNNKEFIKGFEAGKKFMKEEIIKLIK